MTISRPGGRSNGGIIVKYNRDGNPLWTRQIDF
jgi:hypothetical protein